MKTLDEVIKACEETVSDVDRGVDIEGCFLGATETRDALQWLKGYKAHIELDKLRDKYGVTSQNFADTSQITCPKCHSEFVILPESNDPLTWEQLKQMEGKPVWVEEPKFFGKRWVIISGMNDEAVFGTSIGSQVFYCKEDQGTEWQAYRKERMDEG